jgi:hypothetical protein
LHAERDRLDKEIERLTDEIDEHPVRPFEELPPSSIGRWLITGDYQRHFDQAIARASGERRGRLELEKERVLALCREVDERQAAAKQAAGINALEEQKQALVEQWLAIQEKLMTTPAKTLAGVEIHLSVLRWHIGLDLCDDDERLAWIDTISAGARALGGEQEARS